MNRRVILVTGAPRTATTPVGNLLAQCRGTVSLYEPLGPTGLSRVGVWFPMVGDDLGVAEAALPQLIDDLAAFRPGKLKPQARGGRAASLVTSLFGSRTLHSVRLARLQPWARTVIWKDPHAIMMVPDLVEAGLDVVVTARTPRAHAASYRRLDWHSKARDVYPRWSARYGRCEVVESFLNRSEDSVISAALLWRLSYLPLLRTETLRRVHLITSEALEQDEQATYRMLIGDLGLTPTRAVERTLSREKREARASEMSQKTHDWTRSVASVNQYWKDVLSHEDLRHVDEITSDLEPALFPRG